MKAKREHKKEAAPWEVALHRMPFDVKQTLDNTLYACIRARGRELCFG
jgi:hypothetical protein